MVKNLINEIEQAMLGSLNNEQLAQLRKVLDYTFRNIVVTEKDSVNAESNNQILVENFISAKKVEGCSPNSIAYYRSTINNALIKLGEEAIILSTREEDISRLTYSVKDIQGAVDTFRYFTPEMLKTAWWISSYYLCTLIDALRLFLIDKKGIKTKVYYSLCWDKIPKDHPLRGLIDESVEMLTEEDCLLLFTDSEFAKTLSNGYIARRESVKASHREPLERWIAPTLPIPKEETARKKKQVLLYAFLT